MRRSSAALGALLLALIGSLALAAPASAYPPVPPALSVQSGATTDTGIAVQVTNAKAGSVVTFSFDRIAAAGLVSFARAATSGSTTATADASGTASAILDATEAGLYSVVATGTDQADAAFNLNGTATVTEVTDGDEDGTEDGDEDGTEDGSEGSSGSSGGSGEELADTGSNSTTLLVSVGVGALVLGGTALVAARGRRWGSES